jgi:hypothetical protein
MNFAPFVIPIAGFGNDFGHDNDIGLLRALRQRVGNDFPGLDGSRNKKHDNPKPGYSIKSEIKAKTFTPRRKAAKERKEKALRNLRRSAAKYVYGGAAECVSSSLRAPLILFPGYAIPDKNFLRH